MSESQSLEPQAFAVEARASWPLDGNKGVRLANQFVIMNGISSNMASTVDLFNVVVGFAATPILLDPDIASEFSRNPVLPVEVLGSYMLTRSALLELRDIINGHLGRVPQPEDPQ